MKKLLIILFGLFAISGNAQIALWQIEYQSSNLSDWMIITSSGEQTYVDMSTVNLSMFNDDLTHTTAVSKNSGATVGTRSVLNLIEGSGVTLTITDDAGGDEVDVTIAASGGSSLWNDDGTYTEQVNNTDPIEIYAISGFNTNAAWNPNGVPNVAGFYNTNIGWDVMNSATSASLFNVALGFKSSFSLTSADYVISIGKDAAYLNQTQNDIIAIGTSAAYRATGSLGQISIGTQAGYGVTTGDYNIFMGYGSGDVSTAITGSYNINLGVDTGDDLTSGSFNFFGGLRAGADATTSIQNIALGTDAMRYHDASSDYNVFIGNQSGMGDATNSANADNNVGIGAESLRDLTTGDGNLAVGQQAGANIESGSYNVLFGRSAGAALTTASYNTFFGYQAGITATDQGFSAYFGYNAGEKANGERNSFFGYLAGSGKTTGTVDPIRTTAIGTQAADNIVDASYAVYIGSEAAINHESGDLGVYIGHATAPDNISGARNVIIGAYAGYGLTGSDLLFIDAHTVAGNAYGLIQGDFSANTLEFNSNEILLTTKDIGSSTDVELILENDGGSYIMELNIFGDIQFVPTTSSDDFHITDTGEIPIFTVDVSTDRVGINTISPTQELHVVGDARIEEGIYDSNNSNGDSGDILISDGNNIDWRDNPAGAMYHSSTQVISSRTQIQFNTVEFTSGDGITMDNTNDEIDIIIAGTYEVTVSVNLSAAGKLTTNNNAVQQNWYDSPYAETVTGGAHTIEASHIMELSASDNLEFYAEPNSGSVTVKQAKCSIKRIR